MCNNYREIINKYNKSIKINEDISKYHTFRIKGNADIIALPKSKEELIDMLCICRKYNYNHAIIGNGSNILFNNNTYKGVLILTRNIKNVVIDDCNVYCECGVSIPLLASKALKSNLKGLEKLSGIPGTIGGGINMNAGAYGAEIKDILVSATVYDINRNEIYTLNCDELEMTYRHTILKENNLVLLSCNLKLERGNYEEIKEVMDACKKKRLLSQPLEYPSAGSIFKKEGDYFAGKLIDELGLKGYSIGGATVSYKHANFIVNENNAVTDDVKNLIKYIKKAVHDKYKIDLKTEVEFL